MTINNVVGLFAALIGTTATLLGAWAYIRSQHPPKKEMLRAALAIAVIMICILGCAVAISHATTIKVNGQETVPVPSFLRPASGTKTPIPVSTKTPIPASTKTPIPASTPTFSIIPASASTPTFSPTQAP